MLTLTTSIYTVVYKFICIVGKSNNYNLTIGGITLLLPNSQENNNKNKK
jgi:hypothetical protein